MPIHVPGKRNRKGKLAATKRSTVASLSLTAMVDMFTVLTIFLLQNYKETGEVIQLRNDVTLPQATQIRELEPANVVIVSKDMILVNENQVIPLKNVEMQSQWLIYPLYQMVRSAIAADEKAYQANLRNQLKEVVAEVRQKNVKKKDFRQVTLQADKDTDFITIKKIMYTLTEAGASEINFAVLTVSNKLEMEEEEGEETSL
jgi:biopolymer transport protein ExbD